MLAIRNMLKTNPQFIRNVVQQRNMSATCVPARKKVSGGELMFLGSFMMLSWLAIPAWVAAHIKNYRDKN